MDTSTLTESSIFICRTGTGEKHPLVLGVANGGTTVTLTPTQPFIRGGSYELYLNCSIKSKGGKALAQAMRMPFTIFAPPPDNSRYTLWTGSMPASVAPDKEWQIDFSREIDVSTLADTTIFICKAGTGERHRVTVGVASGPDNRATAVRVTPVQPYTGGGSYVLYIEKSLKSKSDFFLRQGIRLPFLVSIKQPLSRTALKQRRLPALRQYGHDFLRQRNSWDIFRTFAAMPDVD